MKRFVCFLALFLMATFADASPKNFYGQKASSRSEGSGVGNTRTPDASGLFGKNRGKKRMVYLQKLDHFDANDTRTFDQRYYENSDFAANRSAPVILYICGESECKSSSLLGQVRSFAAKLKARIVSLEHRYYGQSQPFARLTTQNLKFLSTPQALADLNAFQKWYTSKNRLTGKWLAVGGSYAGNLAAYYRSEYPENVSGALASSAPVRAHEAFKEYDEHVSKAAGKECVKNMLQVSDFIEARLNNPAELKAIKKKFNAEIVRSEKDFLYLVTDVASAAVQYGMKDEFCGDIAGRDKLNGYAKFAKKLFTRWGVEPVEFTFQIAESTDIPNSGAFGMRAWLYQSCTEYGYWQIASDDESKRSRSKKIDLEYHRDTCARLFNIQEPAPTVEFNEKHYEPLLDGTASNILFTNGTDDPWSALSILTSNQSNEISTFKIFDAAHCDDLRRSSSNDSRSLRASRDKFVELARTWL